MWSVIFHRSSSTAHEDTVTEKLKKLIADWEARKAEIARLHRDVGLTPTQIAKTVGITRQRVYQVLIELGLWTPKPQKPRDEVAS